MIGWNQMKNSNRVIFTGALFICCMIFQSSAGKSTTLILKNANYNRNTLVNGKLVSVLEGNVIFKYSDAVIRSDRSTWYRETGRAYFSGHVNIKQPDQLLTCEKMNYNRDKKRIVAQNNVNFYNSKEQTRIVSQHAVYYMESRHLTLTKNPQMFRYDTTRAETLSISGEKLIYNDSMNIAIAEKNVRISKGLLESKCETATYYLNSDIAKLRTDPWIYYDIHELTGDSVDLFFVDNVLTGVAVMRNAKGFHRDVSSRDTIYTKVSGDSLYMDISDSGTIEKIWTFDNATTIYYSSRTPDIINEAVGKVMILDFVHGTTGTLTIAGNAECIYYLEDDKESGRNEATGDDMLIHFREGKAVYIKMFGGVRGTYFAERTY